MLRLFAFTFIVPIALGTADAAPGRALAEAPLTAESIDRAAPRGGNDADPALIVRAETILDRARFSPGAIDGLGGDNFRNAVRAFQQTKGLAASGKLDADTWKALTAQDATPAMQRYTITVSDVAGPFTRAIPAGLEQMARLPGLSYTGPAAELAEKFHMSQSLLRRLNSHADLNRAGTTIVVAGVPGMALRPGRHAVEATPPKDNEGPAAATMVVDKPARNVRVYDRDGKLLGFYPATIGSEEKPAPSGVFRVNYVKWNPEYKYDPKFAWKGVNVHRVLTVAPGPNNPVGLVWIDLSAPSYGIHGTPAPEDIGKTESHGCVRLTNWDAVELAAMARPGTTVRFDDQDSPVTASPPPAAAPQSSASGAATKVGASPSAKQPSGAGKEGKGTLVSQSGMSASDYSACLSDLRAAKVAFDEIGDASEQGCKLSGAVRLSAVATDFGDVAFPGKPIMLCSFARQLGGWVREAAAPLTLAYSGRKLARIDTAGGFSCRARYDKPGAVPSEHAKGDAVDIVAFDPAEAPAFEVKEGASDAPPGRGLVHAARMAACGYFTTVLGPGANAEHADHLHFDSGQHGATPNYRICE